MTVDHRGRRSQVLDHARCTRARRPPPRPGIGTTLPIYVEQAGSGILHDVDGNQLIDWWQVVAGRLHLGHEQIRRLRADLDARQTWNRPLLDSLAAARGMVRTAIVSNAWPTTRDRLRRHSLDQIVDEVVLSCELGMTKPTPGSTGPRSPGSA